MNHSKTMNRRTFVTAIAATAAVCKAQSTAFIAASSTTPELPSIWGTGQLLAFSALDGKTDYASGLVARSIEDPVGIRVVLPANAVIQCGKRIAGAVQITSDTFSVTTEKGKVQGAFVDAYHLLIEGPCHVTEIADALRSETRDGRTLLGVRAHFNPNLFSTSIADTFAKRQHWLLTQRLPSNLASRRKQTLLKTLSVMKGQVNSPEGIFQHRWTTPDRWPHRDLWLWDSVFHAMGWRHVDMAMARDAVAAVFDGQRPDGCIPHQLSPMKASAVTQPPLLAFGVQQLTGSPTDKAWVEQFYPKLKRYLQWDFDHRMSPDPAAHWFIDPDPLSRSGESGMDNSPRFDTATRLYAVDFNVFLSLECEVMAELATRLNLPQDAMEWRKKHEDLNRQINAYMWNEEKGFYFDYDPASRKQTNVMAVTGFLPLLCGAANGRQVSRLIAQMQDPKTFGTAFPLPSALSSEGFANPHDMWRGPVWVNTNWLVARGLDRVGHAAEASRLREATMNEIERWYIALGSVFEFYDENGKTAPDKLPRKGTLDPSSPYHQAIHDYGWSCTLYTDLVFSALNDKPRGAI